MLDSLLVLVASRNPMPPPYQRELHDATECAKITLMLGNEYEGQICSIARGLELVGERWTLLVVREIFHGRRKFSEMQRSLGVARNVLTARLQRMVDEGILERRPYSERPERYEYRLTRKGVDLQIALAGLRQWGDRYLSDRPPRLMRRISDRKPVVAAFVPKGADAILRSSEVETVPGPGGTAR